MFRTNQQKTKYTIRKSQIIVVHIFPDASAFSATFRGTTINATVRQFAVDGGRGRKMWQDVTK
jgi:hypothetical protein